MTIKQITTIVVQRTKDVQIAAAREIAAQWNIAPDVISDTFAGATFGLGVTMMFENGYTAEQIVEMVRRLVSDLSTPPDTRGAS